MRRHRLHSDDPWEQFNNMLADLRAGLDELHEQLKEIREGLDELQNQLDELWEGK